MTDLNKAVAVALALPEVAEQDHHGRPSYRVRGRIFMTVPDEDHLHVMAGEHDIRAAVADEPAAYQEHWWGKRLACVRIALAAADPDRVAERLDAAWRRKAPPRLLAGTPATRR